MKITDAYTNVKDFFERLYPGCTVIFENPDSSRPKMPFIVLKFGVLSFGQKFAEIENGVVVEHREVASSLTVEMVTSATTKTIGGEKTGGFAEALPSLAMSIPYIESEYAGYWMRETGVVISVDGDPFPVYNSMNGASTVNRAQINMTVHFVVSVEDFASLRPAGGRLEQTTSGVSAEIAAAEAGFFDDLDISMKEE